MRPGLDEGEVSRSRDAAALPVVLKQLLQSLHVEPVTVVYLGCLGGLGTWQPGWGGPLQGQRPQVGEGPRLHTQLMESF